VSLRVNRPQHSRTDHHADRAAHCRPRRPAGRGLVGCVPDLMRHLLGTVINASLSAQADAVRGAEWGQPGPERVAQRNGHRPRARHPGRHDRRRGAHAAHRDLLPRVAARAQEACRDRPDRRGGDLDGQVEALRTRPLGDGGPFTFLAADALAIEESARTDAWRAPWSWSPPPSAPTGTARPWAARPPPVRPTKRGTVPSLAWRPAVLPGCGRSPPTPTAVWSRRSVRTCPGDPATPAGISR
jgi:hypothetical protein